MSELRRPLVATLLACLAWPMTVGTGLAAAPGKVKVGVDHDANVSFSINGRSIDVRLRPAGDTPNPLLAKLAGAGVVVACKGTSPKHHRELVADIETAWPAGTDLLRVRLSRDASDAMQWCVLEQPDGTDLAVTRKLRTPKPAAVSTPTPTPQPQT
jgi:hypothetical protein